MSLASKGKSVAAFIAVGLALPVLGARAWSTAYADRLAVNIAAGVSAVVPSINPLPNDEALADFDLGAPPQPPSSGDEAALAAPSKDGKARAHGRPGSVSHGIRISANQVLMLAARRAMPQAVPVKATAQHPAGLMLRGVSALGVGLQDGDVLTEAAGQKATSVATVVGIVLAARGRQVPEISGRFYRGWVPYGLSVEQPYPKQPVPG
ncbi:MAG: hypothetical protein ABUL62_12445 [Myxococcales bacterium]